MAEQSRGTLKNFFRTGSRPTEPEFGDLIDSFVHKQEEGFMKTPENGVMITAPIGQDALVSFYRTHASGPALWSMRYAGTDTQLVFQPLQERDRVDQKGSPVPPAMSMHRDGRVGINRANPEHALDVDGTVRAAGRVGLAGKPAFADEEWYDVTNEVSGCQAFEIVATTGVKGSGRHALLHAVALNAFNPAHRGRSIFGLFGLLEWLFPRRTIRAQSAYYGRRCDQLELRWFVPEGQRARYKLQIRSRCDYGADTQQKVPIVYGVTRLWGFDDVMTEAAS